MSFKSLIIFALVASFGRVIAAPLGSSNLGARDPCTGIWCARFVLGNGHSDLSRRLASFDGNNVTLSSSLPADPTPSGIRARPSSATSSVDPSSTTSSGSVDPSSTISSVDPSSTPSVDPSSILSIDPSSVGPFVSPSSTLSVDPSSSTPPVADGGVVTITVTSTVISTVLPNPTESPAPPNSVDSSSLSVDPSSTLSGDPSSSTSSVSLEPALSQPAGLLTSFSSPAPTPSPTVVQLTNDIPDSSASSDPAGQPSPSPTGIIFLPPA